MPIPSEIQRTINQINGDINQIERETTKGIEIVNRLLSRFPNNRTFTEYVIELGNYLFFVEITRRQVENLKTELLSAQVSPALIQEIGEFLSSIQGRVFDAISTVDQILKKLENLL